ncbi:dihydrofolate reductase [Marinigracilibium pacificum]|uniref:Dihydrofolate reductase n=1 Tax=Marinigracilibium pacificum TaxID=2729599 RepID=A0A848JB13_9BACT|nr:dihydrofolate reductase [Marinigracilibium pacificum]NMM50222.1 dihydrofolate reductase [Marinigracilibium pacificum]
MRISMIAAMSDNRVIGKDNDLIWHMPSDMNYFKVVTRKRAVIMGRKNYESLPENFRPLPGRTNIVMTRNENYEAPGCIVVNSAEAALEAAANTNESEVFVIGGEHIYELFLPNADKIYLTEIKETFEGDAFFPEISNLNFKEVSRIKMARDSKNPYDYHFTVLEKEN